MNKALALLAAVAATVAVPHAAWAANDGKNRVVTLENLSSQAVYYFYASPQSSGSWEEDLLGSSRTIAAGASMQATIDNGTNECIYDLKAVMANGKEHIQRRINVCAVSKWVIGDSGNSVQ